MSSEKFTITKKTPSLTCAGLFAGIGGFCFGFEKAGFQTIWASDRDEKVALTYRDNFPDVNFIQADLNDLDLNTLPVVDVLHAGFPCQSFSQAGNRTGFDDPRGQLFNVMIEKITSMPSPPKILVFENSPYLQVGGSGLWFDHVRSCIRRAGYWFGDGNSLIVNTLDHFGLPQNRKRLFMIGVSRRIYSYNPFTSTPSLVKPRSLLDFVRREPVTDSYYYLSDQNRYGQWLTREGVNMKPNQLIQLRKSEVRVQPPNKCPTLTANMGSGGHNVPFLFEGDKLRKLTERECLRLQGFPENFKIPKFSSRSTIYHQIGNSVSPIVSEWLAGQIKLFLTDGWNDEQMAI
jgi:DNA (cytosine-5)-methyltransferase 1